MMSRRTVLTQTGLALTGAAALVSGLTPPAQAQSLGDIFSAHDANATAVIDHSAYGAFLDAYVRDSDDGITRVAYSAVSDADHQALKNYIAGMAALPISAYARDEQYAYWLNMYNAVTLDVILDAYPVDSIRDITSGFLSFGPWKKKLVTVEGEELSLDNIEHDILRKAWDDNRVHYGVNCASIGCPNLARVPYTSATLETMLDAGARAYVNHPRGVGLRNGVLIVSSIYQWFDEDFGGTEQGVLAHLSQYAEPALAETLTSREEIDGYRYDWSLNEV